MKKFIKYNLTFILLFTIFFTSINIIKAEYVVNIKDGCVYTCGSDKDNSKCEELTSIGKDEAGNSYNHFVSENPNAISELKYWNFYEDEKGNVNFYRDNDTPYKLHEDLIIVHYGTGYTGCYVDMVCNKNEEGDIERRCFLVKKPGLTGGAVNRCSFYNNDSWEYIGGWGSYNPKLELEGFDYKGFCTSDERSSIPYHSDYSSGESGGNSTINSCFDLKDEDSCKTDNNFSCIWVNKGSGYCNVDNLQYIECGDAFDIPSKIPPITSFIINFLKIVTPIVLIVVSIISLVKAIMASKEDEMQKATQGLKKKVIAAVMVFFVINIVQFVIFKVADSSETGSIGDCLSCFINNSCEGSEYFKTNVNGRYECHYLSDINKTVACPEDKR